MTSPAPATVARDVRLPARIPRSRTTWALAFVFMSLLALVIVPIVIERSIDDLREEIEEVAEPAREWLREAKLAAAWEAASMRGYLLSDDERFLGLYQNARAEEARAFEHLHRLVRRLDPATLERFVELRALGEERRARKDALVRGEMVPREYAETLAAEQTLHLEFL